MIRGLRELADYWDADTEESRKINEAIAEIERLRKSYMQMFENRNKWLDSHDQLEVKVARLRHAISESLSAHKWNNEESARILELALEYDNGIDVALGEHYEDIAKEAEALANGIEA